MRFGLWLLEQLAVAAVTIALAVSGNPLHRKRAGWDGYLGGC